MLRAVWGFFMLQGLKFTLTLKGLIFEGFWAQRLYYIRLLGCFDAKG